MVVNINSMQQINQTGLRLGTATGWQVSRHEKTNADLGWRYVDTTRKELAKRGLFCLNAHVYNHRGVWMNAIVYYRYLQRSRLNQWLVKTTRRREGALSEWKTRYRIFYKLDVTGVKSKLSRKLGLRSAFPALVKPKPKRPFVPPWKWKRMSTAQRKAYDRKFKAVVVETVKRQPWEPHIRRWKAEKLSKKVRGWADLEWKLYCIHKLGETERLNHQLRLVYDQLLGGRSEVLLYNVMQFVPMINPLTTSRYYIFKRFGGLMYQADLIQASYLAIQFGVGRLLVHTIIMGLERHAAKRKQRRFLKMLEATINRLTTWDALTLAPLLARISIYGKLDAKMRRTHVLLEYGDVQYQQINFLTSAYKQVSNTKFGTSTVQIWLRNVSEFKPKKLKSLWRDSITKQGVSPSSSPKTVVAIPMVPVQTVYGITTSRTSEVKAGL